MIEKPSCQKKAICIAIVLFIALFLIIEVLIWCEENTKSVRYEENTAFMPIGVKLNKNMSIEIEGATTFINEKYSRLDMLFDTISSVDDYVSLVKNVSDFIENIRGTKKNSSEKIFIPKEAYCLDEPNKVRNDLNKKYNYLFGYVQIYSWNSEYVYNNGSIKKETHRVFILDDQVIYLYWQTSEGIIELFDNVGISGVYGKYKDEEMLN